MSEETALEPVDGQFVQVYEQPKALIARATEQAQLLMNIVETQKLYKDISGKKYLLAEAWEIIAAFNEAHPLPVRVDRIEDVDGHVAYEAEVHLVRHGEVISGGVMTCGFDDFPCRGKEGTARIRAAQSAAQTWATSKAARVKFAWIAVLGGFAPTPAEEMIEEKRAERKERQEHMCPIHDVPFFKKGKMKGYAHKTEDGSWCNEDSLPEATESPSQPSQDEEPTTPPLEEIAEIVATIETLKAQVPEAEARSFLADQFNKYAVQKEKTLDLMLGRLTGQQRAEMVQACKDKLEEEEAPF